MSISQITGDGLQFLPLFWVYHDCAHYTAGYPSPIDHYHYGHVHLFTLGYDFNSPSQDAFSGSCTYSFSLEDIWGPRSTDLNQSLSYQVIGTPKWYFKVTEIWRRMYIQRWDYQNVVPAGEILGRQGIKWDASNKILGPFREGFGFSPLYIEAGGRTLPIEYFQDETKSQEKRDNYVQMQAQQMIDAWNGGPLGARFPKVYTPSDWDTTNLAKPTFLDSLYIYPTIEYRQVTQLNWERLPGYAVQHDIDANNFGDGWSQTVQIPYVNPQTHVYNSPFSLTPGVVSPYGTYHGVDNQGKPLVDPTTIPLYRLREDGPPFILPTGQSGAGGYDFVNEPFGLPAFKPNDPAWGTAGDPNSDIPTPPGPGPVNDDPRPNLSGQPIKFTNPYPDNVDGRWVQQCIGGIVQAQAVVTIQHKLGGRQDITVSATQMIPSTGFEGSDQLPSN